MTKFYFFFLFLFSLSLFGNEQEVSKKYLKSLSNSLDPYSISKHLAFYSLYKETEEGQKALEHALQLLCQKKVEGKFFLTKIQASFNLDAIISLINKQEDETSSIMGEKEIKWIETISQDLPNKKLKGFSLEKEEEIYSLMPDEIDLSHALMLAEFKDDEESMGKRKTYELTLDLMALQILAKLPKEAKPLEKIKAISQFIFEEMHFRFPPASLFTKEVDKYTFLPSVLDSRLGVCLGVSIIYVCLAERLDLSLELVTPPGHIYVRYEGEDGRVINIETTARGIHLESSEYLNVDTRSLQIRNKKEVIGLVYFNQAGVFWQREEYDKALAAYQKAEKYLPDDCLLKELMGYQYLFCGKIEEAKQYLEQIKDYVPDFSISKETIAEDFLSGKVDAEGIKAVFMVTDQKRESLLKKKNLLEEVLIKFPEFRAGLFQLGMAWLQLHRTKEAYMIFQKYHELDSHHLLVEYYLSLLAMMRGDYFLSWQHVSKACLLTNEKDYYPKALRELKKELTFLCPPD